MADPLVLDHFEFYLVQHIEAARDAIERFQKADESHLEYLATFYRDWYGNTLDTFRDRFGRDIVGAFKKLQDEGYLEIITSAATHGYLPLLSRDSSIYGQLKAGVESYRRLFGRTPRAVWLPECAYRPAFYAKADADAYSKADGERYYKPGLEEFLAEMDIACFFRFNGHLERFNRLAEIAEAGQTDLVLVAELYERDKLFPNIDYRWFGDRERIS